MYYLLPTVTVIYISHLISKKVMKKILKVTGILLLTVLISILCIGMYIKNKKPDVGLPENIAVEKKSERIEHGKYLANSVAVCMDCHSRRDFSVYAAPLIKESFAQGGQKFGREIGFPGLVYSKNITPYSLGNWTDGEIFRAITTGVSKDGSALFPIMPYLNYGKMDKQDVMDIIAYLRTLPAVKSSYPEKELDFPLNILLNTMPTKAQLSVRPDTNNSVAYGKYLITAASCVDCHSKTDKGKIIAGTEYGGGASFKQPNGVVYSANITPDIATGIGSWNKAAFIQRFRMYSDSSFRPVKLNTQDLNTPMPWYMYATMTDKDLGAIYDYLNTLKPIKNKVIKFQKNK